MYPRKMHVGFGLICVLVLSGCSLLGGRTIQEAAPPAEVAASPAPTMGLPTVTPAAIAPQVTISSPTSNQQFQQTQPVNVVSISVDAQGIVKVELFVDGQLVDTLTNPEPLPNQPFLANQSWQPDRAGVFVIHVKAYNAANAVGESQQVITEISGDSQSGEAPASAQETTTPDDSQAALDGPYLVVTDNVERLNVRAGPSTDYEVVGQLTPGQQAAILGQGDVGGGQWWQISLPDAPDSVGWVIANPEWVVANNAANVPQVTPPPTPVPVAPAAAATPAIANGQILFEEDFSSNDKGWLVDEVDNEYGQSKQGPVDGQYQLSTLASKQQVWESVTLPQILISDFQLNFKASIAGATGDFSSGPPAVAASFWRGETLYVVYFSSQGYQVRTSATGDDAELAPTSEWAPSPAFNLEPGTANQFSVLASGSDITLYSNGIELTTLSNAPTDRASPIWLRSYLPEANQSITVNFDDVTVYGDPANLGSNLVFRADRTAISGGECVNLVWWTNNVKEVFYQGEGVPGTGERQECPAGNTTYRMEVVNTDDSRETQEVNVSVSGCRDEGEFVSDINYPDGSSVAVGETFIKKWRVKNTGSCTWDSQYRWDFASDEENQNNFGREGFPFEGAAGPGQEVEIVQELTAPATPGAYVGQWVLNGPNRDTYTAWVGVNLGVGGISDPSGCLDSGEFLEDVTYPDGSTVTSNETFTKKWRIKNTGNCTWSDEYYWSFSSSAENGNNFGVQTFPFIGTVGPGEEVEISQDLTAPTSPGQYAGQWLLLKQGRQVAPAWVNLNIVVQ